MNFAMKNALAFFLMLASFEVSFGSVYKVGESVGWTSMSNIDYNNWANSKNIQVGDTLLFDYNKEYHNVQKVSQKDYQSCDGSSATATYNSGSDSITLDKPGHYYFLCGFPGHCEAGQKVHVLVKVSSKDPKSQGSQTTTTSSAVAQISLCFSNLFFALGLVALGLSAFA